ncbi:hypothetical protein J7337_013204 [Fusarium musae]|uniref:Myb-like domain-containing protein n=1 Tax=Fusarium musae TaxID=1042133 RepID=A0A9P8IHC5_9HYPO|nr:hypothetical protein J7337_013204 [Fusarium musae]KAG9494975.1 hypothetical protein J7337_013204 [Fusarium musae]
MALVIKSYDPAQHQQRAQRRRQKRSAKRSTLSPRSAACVGSPFSPTLTTGLEISQPDDRFIPPNNPDSTTEMQNASFDPDLQHNRLELQQKLQAAIATTPSASEFNCERETYNDNASCISISEKASDEENSPTVSVWSPDADTTQSAGSSINTPSVESPACHIENQRDQVLEPANRMAAEPSSSVSSNEPHNSHGQDLRDLALVASTALETVTEPAVAEPAIASSTKRSLSESGVIDDSYPLVSDICQPSKRPKLTSPSCKEVISTLLLDMQELISKTLAKLDVDQPQSSGVCTSSTSDTIIVATDGGGASISIDDASASSGLPKGRLRRTRRRKWGPGEDKLLQDLKRLQQIHQHPADRVIAARLNRTESAVKQHWDIMEKERRRLRETRYI